MDGLISALVRSYYRDEITEDFLMDQIKELLHLTHSELIEFMEELYGCPYELG